MVSGQISDAQISVSSSADRGWVAENARLLTGRTGWTGQQVKQPFRNEWIQVGARWGVLVPGGQRAGGEPGSGLSRQVDLGQEKMLSGVMIQGGKHRDKNVFMKKFRVGHSLDGEDWALVKEDNSSKPKVGDGRRLKPPAFQSRTRTAGQSPSGREETGDGPAFIRSPCLDPA